MDIKGKIISLTVLAATLSPLSVYAASEVDQLKSDVQAAGNTIVNAAEDTAITAKVKALLAAEADVRSLKIGVTTTDHVVYLDGQVDTRLQAHRVVELAQSIKGVTDVNDSNLSVTSSNNFFEDAFITAKVKGKILQLYNDDKIAKGYSLHVETTNGVVHVFGKVTESNDIAIIEQSIKAITDVKDVKTNIDVVKKVRQ